jgi:ApbE superfamily uncharacterized protein (UPF0280 family)
MPTMSVDPRTYRSSVVTTDLVNFEVKVDETDLFIRAWRDLRREATDAARRVRNEIQEHGRRYPDFLASLSPLPTPRGTPPVVRTMYAAARAAGVGPMAAVAGTVAEAVGQELLKETPEVIVENGGDIYISTEHVRTVSIFAGASPLSLKVGLRVPPESLGVCTSSGTVGHSLSFGKADAAVAAADDTALADAVATAVGNRVRTPDDVDAALDFARQVRGVRHVVVIIGDRLGVWGEFEMCSLS